MKRLTTILLAAALVAWPVQPRAQLVPAACLAVTAVVVAAGVAIYVHNCRPQYYCVKDSETGRQWCRTLTRGEAAVESLEIISGPYKDAAKCDAACTNNVPVVAHGSVIVHVERSTNLVDWVEVAQVLCDPDDFFWSETNTLSSAAFYRTWQ